MHKLNPVSGSVSFFSEPPEILGSSLVNFADNLLCVLFLLNLQPFAAPMNCLFSPCFCTSCLSDDCALFSQHLTLVILAAADIFATPCY